MNTQSEPLRHVAIEELHSRVTAEWLEREVPADAIALKDEDIQGIPEFFADIATPIYIAHGSHTRARVFAVCSNGAQECVAEIPNGLALRDYQRTVMEHQLVHIRFYYQVLQSVR